MHKYWGRTENRQVATYNELNFSNGENLINARIRLWQIQSFQPIVNANVVFPTAFNFIFIFLPMEEAYNQLNEIKDTTDLSLIKLHLDRLKRASTLEPRGNYKIDSILKTIFKNNFTADLFDRVEELFFMIRDPRIFLDELDIYTRTRELIVPTLMFIFQLKKEFDMDYEDFYPKLLTTVTVYNCMSEGYLLFLLKALKDGGVDEDMLEPIIYKLSEITVEIPSKNCVKVLYAIIVIFRMHPELFRIANKLGQVYMLLNSFDYIANVAKRIFLEAENKHMRPAIVFLENFVFPMGDEDRESN